MKRIDALRAWPLHGGASSREVERRALATHPSNTLMPLAGLAVARLARALAPHGRTAWIAAGPGNNGGDGLEAAVRLHAAGWQVAVGLHADPARMSDDARLALARAQAAGVPISSANCPFDDVDIAIDALLGLGSSRAPDGAIAEAIRDFNRLRSVRLAVDLPSGLDADTGRAWGDACVIATDTLALLTLKPGLFTGVGRDHAGQVWWDDLGTAPDGGVDAWLGVDATTRASRRHAQHKGSFGDVVVVGGAAGMTGAALLAARAAHAAGAGRTYVDLLDDFAPPFDPHRPELMFRRGWHRGTPESLRRSTVVCGCGGGDAVRAALPRLLSLAGRLVLDADALNAVAADPMQRRLLGARPTGSTVMTPHPLEAARLLGIDTATVQADRVAHARELAERHGAMVVLKGSGSVIASPGHAPRINPTGNAALATAGTGDVLAGWIGGLWSSSGLEVDDAVRRSVWLHGRCADFTAAAPLRAADLIEAMHRLA